MHSPVSALPRVPSEHHTAQRELRQDWQHDGPNDGSVVPGFDQHQSRNSPEKSGIDKSLGESSFWRCLQPRFSPQRLKLPGAPALCWVLTLLMDHSIASSALRDTPAPGCAAGLSPCSGWLCLSRQAKRPWIDAHAAVGGIPVAGHE